MAGKLNSKFFFDYIRLNLFDGRISAKQVEGLNAILKVWNDKYAADDDRYLAYILATAHHETGRVFQPIKEWGGDKYFHNNYDIQGNRPAVARMLGNTVPGDGVKYCGRGFVQLTGRRNYTDWSKRLNIDLVGKPELALGLATASEILITGMIKGTFTGKSLSDYFSAQSANWQDARKIINGKDKAQLIASYALKYYAAISYTL
ncbi:chitinase [Pararhizobium polonicum]|uniref:Chitinase n=1 Tax=Pararhizobium polonicum TaxID=1612624 RepID=A0A1C7NXP8_9HYPH|nr:hypothetical protein [Pararhizobium polonicum]OBZ93765.1 chitinase [Pararhizobium polonicum]